MGKYAATRATSNRTRSGRAWKDTVNSAMGGIQNEGDYRFQSFLYGFDPTGLYRSYVTYRDNSNYMRDYVRNRNVKWSDIRYPSRTYGFGSDGSSLRNSLMLSANIAKLYL